MSRGGGGGGGGSLWYLGVVYYQNLKIPLRPKALISGQKSTLKKKQKNADFLQYKNTLSFIKTMTSDEREHIF